MKHQHYIFIIKKGALIALLFFGFNKSLLAQNSALADTVQYAFLPALAYNSDVGFIVGGLASRYAFKDNTKPFYSYIHTNLIVSTKGLVSTNFIYDKPNAFGSEVRVTTETYASRFLQNQFYGIANYAKLADAPETIPDYYQYQSLAAGTEVTVRKPILKYTNGAQIDLFGLTDLEYRTPFSNQDNILINQEKPYGVKGSHAIALGTGLIFEFRDSEFVPTRGMYSKVGIEVGNQLLGSSSDYFKFESEISSYYTFFLIKDITFANRFSFQHSSGTLPYWKLPELGGENSMRGYPESRFRDDNALFLNSELRTWLFDFPEYNLRLGGTLFMDIGRTYAAGATLRSVFDDLKYTFGFGSTSSFFNENFIMRGDFGFSDEGLGIYFTAGYLF